MSGRTPADVYDEMHARNGVVISEPFANKHRLKTGATITLPLGAQRVSFPVVDVAYDYSSEAGFIAIDRDTLLRYLPDRDPSNVALYVKQGVDPATVRAEVEKAVAGHNIMIFSNRMIREQAIQIFDRTFLITYALEIVSIVVAVIGIAGALLALVVDRRASLDCCVFWARRRRRFGN